MSTPPLFPTTRYQGSKRKLLPWLRSHLQQLPCDTVLDVFGGTAAVSWMFKSWGKSVTYNDLLPWNQQVGRALIENCGTRISEVTTRSLLDDAGDTLPDAVGFIQRTFADVFFTDAENAWLDRIAQRVPLIADRFERAIAYYALFQACLSKRPYNLFHRRNLHLRLASVTRNFGNKVTWDRPFELHFERFVQEANAAVFDGGQPCEALCLEAADLPIGFDLVYLDPPYLASCRTGVDYGDFYHFLDGLTEYSEWPDRVDHSRRHLPLLRERSAWSDPKRTMAAWKALCARHQKSILVVSYRSDGFPEPDTVIELLRRFKDNVTVVDAGTYQYALSKNRRSRELLFIAR